MTIGRRPLKSELIEENSRLLAQTQRLLAQREAARKNAVAARKKANELVGLFHQIVLDLEKRD